MASTPEVDETWGRDRWNSPKWQATGSGKPTTDQRPGARDHDSPDSVGRMSWRVWGGGFGWLRAANHAGLSSPFPSPQRGAAHVAAKPV